MTARDRWVLRWIAEQYAARFDHLQQLLSRQPCSRNAHQVPGQGGLTASAVHQVIDRWTRSQWVIYKRVYADSPGWVWVRPRCMQLLGLTYAPHTLKVSTLEHIHWINVIRLDVERRHAEYRWVSERSLRAVWPRRREGEKVGHVPDAQIWLPEDRVIAVEVELSPKSRREVSDILDELLLGDGTSREYHTVWYFVSGLTPVHAQARQVVESARQCLPAALQARVQVIELERVERS